MEPKALVVSGWDDLVFTNRNKEYGAYTLRKAYSERLMMGLGASTALMAVLFFIATHQNAQRKGIEPPIFDETRAHILPPPVLNINPPVLPKQQHVRKTNASTAVQVVREHVEEAPIVTEPVQSFSEEGTETGTADVPVGDVSGTGDIPAVVTPVPEILLNPEVMPSYEGGNEAMYRFIRNKFRYPSADRRLGIEGTVYVSFVVNGDGTISQVNVLRGVSSACDKEAIRVISMMPGWIGGKQNGNPVRVRMVLPIRVKLN